MVHKIFHEFFAHAKDKMRSVSNMFVLNFSMIYYKFLQFSLYVYSTEVSNMRYFFVNYRI